MKKYKLVLFLIICIVTNTFMTVGSVSANDKFLTCPSKVGDISIDWRSEKKGLITEREDGIHQAVCTYVVKYDNFDNPIIFASILVQWCEELPCDGIAVHSGHYINDVWSSNNKWALVATEIQGTSNPKIRDASQKIQDLKMNLLEQAEALAISKGAGEEVGKTPMAIERERIREDYPGLEDGALLYAEGTVSKWYIRWATGNDDFGHVGIYVGNYQVPEGERFKVRDEEQVPLKVFRNGKERMLKLGEFIEEGDWIIGAIVEMRGTGAVLTTVDAMKASSRRTMGRYNVKFDWATTDPPPNASQVQGIKDFVLSKVALTEEGKLTYWFGKQGVIGRSPLHPIDTAFNPKELWDCVSLGEAAYESVGLDPTPDYKDIGVSIQPQEQYDNIRRAQKAKDRMTAAESFPSEMRSIAAKIWSPVNLHLYDNQNRHVGITTTGSFERDIPNAYLFLELEEEPQTILIENVDEEYTLVTEATGDGTFDLQIYDINVRSPGNLTVIEFQGVKITKGAMGTLTIGSTDKDILIAIDDDGDGKTDRTIEPSSIDITRSSTDITPPSPSSKTRGKATGIVGESRTVVPGGTVSVPVILENVEDIGSLNFNVTYDSSVINIDRVDKGSLLSGISFAVNPNETDIVRFGFATVDGVSGTGPIGHIVCDAVGSDGSYTPLAISGVEATDSFGNPVTLETFNGSVTIDSDRVVGDTNGDGVLTELDALAALRMSVNLMEEDLILDMDQDGRVTAKDALAILSIAVRGR